jgi:protein ImuB
MRWTPRVHIEREHGPVALVLDLTGCLPANGGALRVVRRVRRAFMRRGVAVQLGMASTAGGAIALSAAALKECGASPARAAHALRVAPPADPWPALDALPLTALRLEPSILQGLLEVNVCTIGELRAIARPALADRYGPQAGERLDALSVHGRAWPFRPVAPPQRVAGEFTFASPCTQLEAVESAMRQAVEQLCDQLRQRMRGVCTLEVRVERARMAPVRGRMYFGAATRNPQHLWTLLAPRVERMQLGCHEHGMGIERIELVALRLGSAQCDATQQAVAQLVDQLCARLGSGRVRSAESAVAERGQ